MDYEANKSRNLDPKPYSYSTSLHTFTVTSSWVFSYVKIDELWIPTNHMGLKGLKMDTPVAILPGAWRYRVSAGAALPGVSRL